MIKFIKKGIISKELSRIYFIFMNNKYHNSKIYAVKNNFNSEIYIGSATTPLCKRMVKHRCDAKQRPHLSKFYTYMNENGIESFYIVSEKTKAPCVSHAPFLEPKREWSFDRLTPFMVTVRMSSLPTLCTLPY